VMSLHASGFVVMMVLIGGGLVSFWGPAIGAVFFILARDVLGAATETWLLWYGLLFVVMVLWQPEGIAGLGQSWTRRRLAGRRERAGRDVARPAAAGDKRAAVPALGEGALHGPL
jgi:branched-chain amino acid transport system permease protein